MEWEQYSFVESVLRGELSEILSCLIYNGFNGYLKQLEAKRPKLKAVSYGRLVTQRSETLVSARGFLCLVSGACQVCHEQFYRS